jgi:hypothetical protein
MPSIYIIYEACGSLVVKALGYKLEGSRPDEEKF